MEQQPPRACEGVHLTLPPHIFFCPSKVWSMLHHESVEASSEQNKISLTLTLTFKFLLPSNVFHNKICILIMIRTALSFLWLIHGLCWLALSQLLFWLIEPVSVLACYILQFLDFRKFLSLSSTVRDQRVIIKPGPDSSTKHD